ncbi:MAG TPA: hypothetical protein P5318_02700 [Candidatus Hydrogenedentes bacterium]|nr:hypothetical protein [Candidatus Hydrogenedentota bacterium]HRT19008.1 hypothetical protein [Candidatus Hydrogenedentota bacterium]HRT65636.1 hypothetical protein [Candidatus Hydrogenedentota bacterium]
MKDDSTACSPQSAIRNSHEWIAQLERYIDAHDGCGFDPFDIKQHRLVRAAQPYPLLRKATSLFSDALPNASRSMLRIQPQRNPKTFALAALGRLRRFEATGGSAHLDRARYFLQWLIQHAEPGYAGLAWGYPFDVHAKGLDTPRGTPIAVVAAIAGEAFALAFRITGDAVYREAVASIADHLLHDIPRMPQNDGTICFAYTPGDRRRVHNANLHVAAHLVRTHALTGADRFLDPVVPALRFTLERQRPDGSWPYGEYEPSEPFEESLLRLVDHYHTGFVLRSLYEILGIVEGGLDLPLRDKLAGALESGYAYYRDRLFAPDGAPINGHGRYPVDIHACAESILCPAMLSKRFPDARERAVRSLEWAYSHMRNTRDGTTYYRKYPFFTSRLVCMRWGVAWMYRALAEVLAMA